MELYACVSVLIGHDDVRIIVFGVHLDAYLAVIIHHLKSFRAHHILGAFRCLGPCRLPAMTAHQQYRSITAPQMAANAAFSGTVSCRCPPTAPFQRGIYNHTTTCRVVQWPIPLGSKDRRGNNVIFLLRIFVVCREATTKHIGNIPSRRNKGRRRKDQQECEGISAPILSAKSEPKSALEGRRFLARGDQRNPWIRSPNKLNPGG